MIRQKIKENRYLSTLEEKVLVFDGAMGTNLESQGLTAEHFGGPDLAGATITSI